MFLSLEEVSYEYHAGGSFCHLSNSLNLDFPHCVSSTGTLVFDQNDFGDLQIVTCSSFFPWNFNIILKLAKADTVLGFESIARKNGSCVCVWERILSFCFRMKQWDT